MKRGDIRLVSLDPTSGHEQQGTRPLLVVSPEALDELTGTPIILPITPGGSFARRHGLAVSLENVGFQAKGVIRCDQPHALHFEVRNGRHIDTVRQNIVDEVMARLVALFE